MSEFEKTVQDFIKNCGYTEKEAICATINILKN